jgi:nucleoside-diphosphate-sugar epimerase
MASRNGADNLAMRITVIGGTGFIGRYVARQLAVRHHEVVVYHRGVHNTELPAGVREILSRDAEFPVMGFPHALVSADADVVIHMVPMGEADTRAAVNAFRGRAGRIVGISSGDVYRAYGVFKGIEPGPASSGFLSEDSPLRSVLYPYRANAKSPDALEYSYEKILVERVLMAQSDLPATILRLPKVYGPGRNADLATFYAFAHHPDWRWTHGYVENVAHAIVLATLDDGAAGRIYNVGEGYTPTIAERLAHSPPSNVPPSQDRSLNFTQDIAYDTSRIRAELGYDEIMPYEEGLRRTLAAR